MSQKDTTKPVKQLLPIGQSTEFTPSQVNQEEQKVAQIPALLLLEPQQFSSEQRLPNDKSELSIGYKTAEKLVGDILASDESLEEDQKMPESSQLNHNEVQVEGLQQRKTDADHNSPSDLQDQNTPYAGDKVKSSVLLPMRVPEYGQELSQEQEELAQAQQENPFEVADNTRLAEPASLPMAEHDQDWNQEDQAQVFGADQEELKHDTQNYEFESKDDTTKIALGLKKQRSNSEKVSLQEQMREKKQKRRRILHKITQFKQKVSETVSGSQQQAPNLAPGSIDKATELVVEQAEELNNQDGPEPKQKTNIISKLFATAKRKNKAQPIEETKQVQSINQGSEPALISATETKQQSSKAGVKSRFVSFFTKVPKVTKKSDCNSEKRVTSNAAATSSVNEENKNEVVDKVEAESSLDVAFRTNAVDDQDGIDALLAQVGLDNDAAQSNQDDEDEEEDVAEDEETDVEEESDITDDEICSALEGLDFRPEQAGILRFEGSNTDQQQENNRLSVQSSNDQNRKSYNQSESSQNSQQATGTFSVVSHDYQDEQQNYEPRQRANSQNAEELVLTKQQTTEGDEWEVSFNQPLNESNNPNMIEQQAEYQTGNFLNSAANQQQELQAIQRNSAGFLGQNRMSNLEKETAQGQFQGQDSHPFAPVIDPFQPSQSQFNNQFGRVSFDKDTVKRSISFQNHQANLEALTFNHLQQNNAQNGTGNTNFLRSSMPFQNPSQMRVSEPFMPSQNAYDYQQQQNKQVNSLGAIQNGGQNLQFRESCPFTSNIQTQYSAYQNVQQRWSDFNAGMSNMYKPGHKQTHLSPSAPNQYFNQDFGRESLTTSRGGISKSSSSRSGMQRNQQQERNAAHSHNASDAQSQKVNQGSNAKKISTTQQDDVDSQTCSSMSQLTARRKRRTRRRNNNDSQSVTVVDGVEITSDGNQPCFCCRSGAIKCILETKYDDYNHMTAFERMKSLIQADQQLQHFKPIETKHTGGSSQNCARAGIEGKIKDDIFHECCKCCDSVRNTLMREMQGIASELSRDQLCSKFIQVQLSRCPSTDAAVIDAFFKNVIDDEEKLFEIEKQVYNEAMAKASSAYGEQTGQFVSQIPNKINLHQTSLMNNVFGNYVIQLIFEKASEERIQHFYQLMLKQVHALSHDQFGCRVLQKALVFLKLDQQLEIIQKFDLKQLSEMILSEEGNYIVQCIIYSLPVDKIKFFLPLIETRLLSLCKDKRGCRIIQRVFEKFSHEDVEPLLDVIVNNANDLTPQTYGNYVVTHIILNGTEEDRVKVIKSIMENMVHFSLYQLGSNVVENCLQLAPEPLREEILKRIDALPLTTTYLNPQVSLSMLLDNQFGNYVIQHAFHLADDPRKREMRDKINKCADDGYVERSSNYAKHVYSLMHNYFISECVDCQKRNRGCKQTQETVTIPTLAEKFSRNAQMQRNQEYRMEQAKQEQQKSEKKNRRGQEIPKGNSNKKSEDQETGKGQKTSSATNPQMHTKVETKLEPEQLKTTLIEAFEQARATAKDPCSNQDLNSDQDNESGSQDSMEEDKEDKEGPLSKGQIENKKKRKRRKRKKPQDHGICQEDVLDALSDFDREEFLAIQKQSNAPIIAERVGHVSVFGDTKRQKERRRRKRQTEIKSEIAAAAQNNDDQETIIKTELPKIDQPEKEDCKTE